MNGGLAGASTDNTSITPETRNGEPRTQFPVSDLSEQPQVLLPKLHLHLLLLFLGHLCRLPLRLGLGFSVPKAATSRIRNLLSDDIPRDFPESG